MTATMAPPAVDGLDLVATAVAAVAAGALAFLADVHMLEPEALGQFTELDATRSLTAKGAEYLTVKATTTGGPGNDHQAEAQLARFDGRGDEPPVYVLDVRSSTWGPLTYPEWGL